MQFKAWNPNVPMDDTVVTTASYTAQYEKITNPNPDPGPGPGPNPNPDPGPTPGPGQTPGEKPGRPDPSKPGNIDREYGSDRVGTGTRISQRYFDKSKYVIVVDSGNYPDALTASVLAKVLDCPILLNNTEYLEENVRKEILRLGADEIIIVGGHNSISEKVREELEPMDINRVQRIWGDDRFITSAQVAREVAKINGGVTKAVIASGEVFPDALASAPLAGKEVAPILLAKKNSIEKPVRDAFKDLGIGSVYISGGPNTLSPKLEDILPRLIVRFSGENRYDTAVLIAEYGFKDSTTAFVASGESWPDALVVGPVAAKQMAPILLTRKYGSKETRDYISRSKIASLTIVGGPNTISDKGADSLID